MPNSLFRSEIERRVRPVDCDDTGRDQRTVFCCDVSVRMELCIVGCVAWRVDTDTFEPDMARVPQRQVSVDLSVVCDGERRRARQLRVVEPITWRREQVDTGSSNRFDNGFFERWDRDDCG